MEMIQMTDKRAGILRALYAKTELGLADFMDKTDLSFKAIDLALSGACNHLLPSEIEGFAKGFDMTPSELLMYLEISDFF